MAARKQLNLFDLTMISTSFVIGMGIFRTPANVAAATPNPALFFLCWLAGGLIALCGAITYAEIGSRVPKTGGYYSIFVYAYHPSIAFAVNCLILVSNAASLAAVALVGSEYLVSILPKPVLDIIQGRISIKGLQMVMAIVSIGFLYVINLLGLKMSAGSQNVLMAVKIGLVIMLILPVFFVDAAPARAMLQESQGSLSQYLKAFGVGLVAVSFSYGGYQQTINFGEEVKNPQKKYTGWYFPCYRYYYHALFTD